MRTKKICFSHFSHARTSDSPCLRPDTEQQLAEWMRHPKATEALTRGAGLSYSDSCFNTGKLIIDSQRLNHLISFDTHSGIAVAQAGATFKDLLTLHPEYIPPVLPGTLAATLGGGVAHDVHGKNNHHAGSFGYHLHWLTLLIGDKTIQCSPQNNPDLFYATIGGLGLTGSITRLAIQLKKASRFVRVEHHKVESINTLMSLMMTKGITYDYQVAWLDLLSPSPRSILSLANHCDAFVCKKAHHYTIPPLPFRIINKWNLKLFNALYLQRKPSIQWLNLEIFNNPLDTLNHWNRLYGPKGLIQCQALFPQDQASTVIKQILQLIHHHDATPTLAVLKLFTQAGKGLLSFCQPGFTLAVDFIHNQKAEQAIKAINQYLSEINGRIYLAKDLLLNAEQYQDMYPQHQEFSQRLDFYQCTMQSDLARRLGIKS